MQKNSPDFIIDYGENLNTNSAFNTIDDEYYYVWIIGTWNTTRLN